MGACYTQTLAYVFYLGCLIYTQQQIRAFPAFLTLIYDEEAAVRRAKFTCLSPQSE